MVISKDQPVYLLAGTEQFLKEEHLAKIKSAFLDKDSEKFNFNIFYAGATPLKEILESARTMPFLGRKRVVLLRGVEDCSVSEKTLILSYVKNRPTRSTCLVLETSESNLNQDFFAEIGKYVKVIFCQPPKERQLFVWIKAQLKPRGKNIADKAIMVLIENLGNNLKLLSVSLDSLILYIGERKTIEAGDVEKLVGPDLNTNVFELFDAVIVQDKKKALQILDKLFQAGVNSAQILGALTSQITSERRKFNSGQLEYLLQQLQTADADIKTGRQNQKIALELLLVRLLQLL